MENGKVRNVQKSMAKKLTNFTQQHQNLQSKYK